MLDQKQYIWQMFFAVKCLSPQSNTEIVKAYNFVFNCHTFMILLLLGMRADSFFLNQKIPFPVQFIWESLQKLSRIKISRIKRQVLMQKSFFLKKPYINTMAKRWSASLENREMVLIQKWITKLLRSQENRRVCRTDQICGSSCLNDTASRCNHHQFIYFNKTKILPSLSTIC